MENIDFKKAKAGDRVLLNPEVFNESGIMRHLYGGKIGIIERKIANQYDSIIEVKFPQLNSVKKFRPKELVKFEYIAEDGEY